MLSSNCNTNNMDKFAVAYYPTNDERSFNVLNLMDVFQWARNNGTNREYKDMIIWMKD